MVQPLGDFEFDTNCLLGTGSFAVVYGGRHSTKKDLKIAVKIIMKKNLAKSPSSLEKEIKILKELTKLKHQNVVCLYDCKETQHNVYLIMEYCNGGELGEYLKKKGCLSEETIRLFFRQIANAIKILHVKGIIHRDLKPPNILLCHNSPNREPSPHQITLKIADFGFARFLQEGVMATTLCGSPQFMSPEVIMSLKYDGKADLWSIGTIIYLCLTNKVPFSATTPQALRQYYEDNPKLEAKIPIETSSELKDLLNGLLRYDAKDRMEFDDFFNHPFFKQTPKNLVLKNQKLPGSPSHYVSPNDVMTGAGNIVDLNMAINDTNANDKDNEDDYFEEDFVIVESPIEKLTSSKGSPNSDCCLNRSQDKKNIKRANNSKRSQTYYEDHKISIKRSNENPPEPKPVPSQKEAFEKMKRSFRNENSSTVDNYFNDNKENNNEFNSSESANSTNSSNKFMTDITQMSPPTVQFMCVGTPPNSAFKQQISNSRRRCSGPITLCSSPTTTTNNTQLSHPNESNSPNYQLGNILSPPTSPILATNRNICFHNSSYLISPNRSPKLDPRFTHLSAQPQSDMPNSSSIVNNQLVRSSSLTENETTNFKWMMLHNSANLNNPSNSSNTSQQRQFTNAFANCFNKLALTSLTPTNNTTGVNNSTHHQFGFMHNFNAHSHLHPYHAYHSGHLNSPKSHNKTGTHFHYYCSNPNQFSNNTPNNPSSLCANFFPIFNNYHLTHGSNDLIQNEMPGLQEETLLEKDHNETLAKLNFIVALVECIINLAESRANPVSVLTESTCKELPKDSYRKAEQLALYLRSLKLINSATNLSQTEINAGRLKLSTMVKNVLSQLTKLLKLCLNKCKQLCTNSNLALASKKELESIVAEKLIFNYAIEMCQSAAVEELFGHPVECFAKYQTAQILLHSLSQQVINSEDKKLLNKYKEAVEKRLYVLQSQGLVFALESNSSS